MAIWINNWHRDFNRLWLVLSYLLAISVLWIFDAPTAIKTFIVAFAIGHIGFLVIFWIIRGFQKER